MNVKKILIDGKEVSIATHSMKAAVKAVGDGIVEAYVSIFGNVDSANEIVEKGAFAESLANKMPKVVWSHNWDEPIGKVLVAREDEKGLYCKFQLVLDVQKAAEAYALLKAGATDEFSIGYSVDESNVDAQGIRHLTKLTLYEVSPVMVGANPDTVLLSVKSAEVEGEPAAEEVVEPVTETVVEDPVIEPTEEPETKGEVQEIVDERDMRTQKWEKFEEASEIFDAFWSAYFSDDASVTDFDGLLGETVAMLTALIGAPTDGDDVEAKKLAFKETMAKAMTGAKSGRVLSDKNRQLIQTAMDAMDAAASPLSDGKKVLEALLQATEAPEPDNSGKGIHKVDEHAMRVKNLILKDVQKIAKETNKVLFRLKRQ